MDSIRIGPALPSLIESEAAGPAAAKPKASVASAPKSAARGDEGHMRRPSAGDEVLVSFEPGDPRAPFVTRGLRDAQAPPTNGTAGTNNTDPLVSEE
jgi:hypothetical protein